MPRRTLVESCLRGIFLCLAALVLLAEPVLLAVPDALDVGTVHPDDHAAHDAAPTVQTTTSRVAGRA